ncbi:MAG: ATP-binding domain-containing protein, partial [Acidimicrobiales bacterium]
AVVAVADQLDQLGARLDAASIANTRVGMRQLEGAASVSLIDPDQVKGLEFDAVIVVEPAAIAELDQGLRRLYVSLTRSVQTLGIVCSRPLPGAIEASLREREAGIDNVT